MKYFKFNYDGSRLFSSSLKVQFEDMLGTIWNNGLPFLSGVLLITTGDIMYVTLFIIPAFFKFEFRFFNTK